MTGLLLQTSSLALLVGLLAFQGMPAKVANAHESKEHNCSIIGQPIDPQTGELRAYDQLIKTAAGRSIVMLGETHPNVEHHRWQLAMISALHGRRPNIVLGFEAFPRAVQPVLDRWVAGELSEDAFLEATGWSRNWGFDPELYLPMFHFARLNQVPIVALNIERDFVSRIRDEGLDSIPEGERRGIIEPRAPSEAYLESLSEVFGQHLDIGSQAPADPEHGESETEAQTNEDVSEEQGQEEAAALTIREDPRFRSFVRVQTTWDGAMAQALAETADSPDKPLVIGVLGTGHLERGFGVPYQLKGLGADDFASFIPMPPVENCEAYEEEVADAVFVLPSYVEAASSPPGPRLGVMIETSENGVRVLQVMEDSVAMAADIRDGDAIVKAAGVAVNETAELIGIVQQQAPGTWLPLAIERDGEFMEIVAKFPALSNGHAKP